jgi:hypothetical protein
MNGFLRPRRSYGRREEHRARDIEESTPNKWQPARATPIQMQRQRCQASTHGTRPGCSAPPVASVMSRTRPCMPLITPSLTQRFPRVKTVAPLFPSHSAQTASPAWRSEKSVGGLPCHALRPRGARSPATSSLDQRVLPPSSTSSAEMISRVAGRASMPKSALRRKTETSDLPNPQSTVIHGPLETTRRRV